MLSVSGMKKSTYFYRLAHLEMSEDELKLKRNIINIFHESFDYYGHRKITLELEESRQEDCREDNEGGGAQVQVSAKEVQAL